MSRLVGRFGLWLVTRPLHRLPLWTDPLFGWLFNFGLWCSSFDPPE